MELVHNFIYPIILGALPDGWMDGWMNERIEERHTERQTKKKIDRLYNMGFCPKPETRNS